MRVRYFESQPSTCAAACASVWTARGRGEGQTGARDSATHLIFVSAVTRLRRDMVADLQYNEEQKFVLSGLPLTVSRRSLPI